MRRFSLAVVLSVMDKGASRTVEGMGRKVDVLRQKFRGVGEGVRQFGRGMRDLAVAGLPVTVAMGAVIKKGADFEASIARLRSKLLDEFDPALTGVAKSLGATTKFSATQAADAMTLLAQAGFEAKEIMGAVPGVLNAAAAEGMDLATAASIVADNVKTFGLNAKDAASVAGTLALASTRANTDITTLQEGLKLAGPIASQVGAKLSDTTAVLGALADIGLKGTLSGTAFRASLTKLIQPTSQGAKALKKLGVSQDEIKKKLDRGDVVGTFQTIVEALSKVEGSFERTQLAGKIFQVRGLAIAGAIKAGGPVAEKFAKTVELLRNEFETGGATAERMAQEQLKSLRGQMVLLGSAAEGVSIELFDMVAGETRAGVMGFSKQIQDLALALRVVRGEKITDPKAKAQLQTISQTTFQVAEGIKEAITEIKAAGAAVFGIFKRVASVIGVNLGGEGVKGITKLAVKFTVLVGAIAPLSIALLGATKLFGGLANAGIGAGRAIFGAFRGVASLIPGVSKIPIIGKLLGKAGGAGRILDQATAQPVRVVNFHEAGGVFGKALGGGTSGSRMLDLGGPGGGGIRGALASFVGRFGRFGALLNTNLSALGKGAGLAGRALGIAKGAGLVAAAGAVGFAFGSLLNKTFGLDEKIAGLVGSITGQTRMLEESRKLPGRGHEVFKTNAEINARKTAEMFARLAESGVTTTGRKGQEQTLTRSLVEGKIGAFLEKQQVSEAERTAILGKLAGVLARIPADAGAVKPAKDAMVSRSGLLPVSAGDVVVDRAALASAVMSGIPGRFAGQAMKAERTVEAAPAARGPINLTIPLMLDGRQVALATAQVELDDLERSGTLMAPGARSAMLQRGSKGSFR